MNNRIELYRLVREGLIEYQRYAANENMRYKRYCEESGIDYKTDVRAMVRGECGVAVGYIIGALNAEIKKANILKHEAEQANAQRKKAYSAEKEREAFERMMRGNYNKFGGEDI